MSNPIYRNQKTKVIGSSPILTTARLPSERSKWRRSIDFVERYRVRKGIPPTSAISVCESSTIGRSFLKVLLVGPLINQHFLVGVEIGRQTLLSRGWGVTDKRRIMG